MSRAEIIEELEEVIAGLDREEALAALELARQRVAELDGGPAFRGLYAVPTKPAA